MYKINRIALILCLLDSLIYSAQPTYSPHNTVIMSDIDDVIIKKSPLHKGKIVLGGVYQSPLNTLVYIKALNQTRKRYTKDNDNGRHLCDAQGNPIHGLTFQFLYHGAQDDGALSHYVEWLVTCMEHSRCYINGTHKIYQYLKEKKGYTIAFATNKDRISYDITAQAFGHDFSDLATHTFVAHPGINESTVTHLNNFAQHDNVPACYKAFLHKALTVQPTETIHHIPMPKPDTSYYHHVCNTLGPDNNIIFIDDKECNVESFTTLQTQTTAQRTGIHFKNPEQLANTFVKLGILSENDDKALLDDVRYPGVWGKIRLHAKQIAAFFTFNQK